MDKKEAKDLIKKMTANGFSPDAVDEKDKENLEELCNDFDTFVSAMLELQDNDEEYMKMLADCAFPNRYDGQTDEQIIAENYIALAKFAIKKLKMKKVIGLKAEVDDGFFTFYALTPKPIQIDLEMFATSDYPTNKELLLEAESLQADLFLEDNTEECLSEIVNIINNAKLD